jgi:hypothetical protein
MLGAQASNVYHSIHRLPQEPKARGAQWRLHLCTAVLLVLAFVATGTELREQRKLLTGAQTLDFTWGFGFHVTAVVLHVILALYMRVLLGRQESAAPALNEPLIDPEQGNTTGM